MDVSTLSGERLNDFCIEFIYAQLKIRAKKASNIA